MFIVALLGMFLFGLMMTWHPEPGAFFALMILIAGIVLSLMTRKK